MISLPKLLLIVLVAGVAWYGWRIWQKKTAAPKPPATDAAAAPTAAEDMVRCPVCQTYVTARARPCERANCPQGRTTT